MITHVADEADFDQALTNEIWWRIPLLAGDGTVVRLASKLLLHTDPTHTIYVELGRDVWDGGAPDFATANLVGARQGLPGFNSYYSGAAWHLVRSLQVFEVAHDLLAGHAGLEVLRVYRMGGNLDTQRVALENCYASPQWNAVNQRIDLLVGGTQEDAEKYRIPRHMPEPA